MENNLGNTTTTTTKPTPKCSGVVPAEYWEELYGNLDDFTMEYNYNEYLDISDIDQWVEKFDSEPYNR